MRSRLKTMAAAETVNFFCVNQMMFTRTGAGVACHIFLTSFAAYRQVNYIIACVMICFGDKKVF